MTYTVAQVIAELTQPEELLRHCYIRIGGGNSAAPANGPASIATFRVSVDPSRTAVGFTTGLSGMLGIEKDRTLVRIDKQPGPAVLVPPADSFNAYYIPMVQVTDAQNASSHYTLPTVGGPDLMMTSRLSGCTFGVGSSGGGTVLVSHIQPDLTTTNPAQRATDLDQAVTGGFATMDGQFRKRQEYNETATVMGLRRAGAWKFYMQALDYTTRDVISHLEVVG